MNCLTYRVDDDLKVHISADVLEYRIAADTLIILEVWWKM